MCKKNQLLVQAPSLLAKSWLRFWSHYGFKNVRNVIEMALKLLFFAAKSQKPLSGRGLCPQATSVIHLTCSGLFITGPKLDNICEKKNFWYNLPLLSKILVALLLALTAAHRFSRDHIRRIQTI